VLSAKVFSLQINRQSADSMVKRGATASCGALLLIAAAVLLLATSSAYAADTHAQRNSDNPVPNTTLIGVRRALKQVG
jgi:hypothetical protein